MFDAKTFFSPNSNDIEYQQDNSFFMSLIFRMDSYKFSHPFAYPEGIGGMSCYGTARVANKDWVVAAGMQMLVKRYLSQTITMWDIDRAEEFSQRHFGRTLFARAAWERVVNQYDGHLPLIIRAVPEGTRVRGGMPIYTVTCLDPELSWMAAAFETIILRGIWYPSTIATNDYNTKADMLHYYEISGADQNVLQYALHDFGGRGVTCAEQAEIGGAVHTFNFTGDTIEGVLAANFFYKSDMSAFSVYATEHSVECSFGGGTADALRYIRHQLAQAQRMKLPVLSIVLDGYDVFREAELCCTVLRDEIIASGVKVVFRPDSGDMMEVVPRILRMQAAAFGYTTNAKGFKTIKHVGVIQGDGVDRASIVSLLGKVVSVCGFTADCVIFGSGGALLQKVNRDTLKFAQKASAILMDGQWHGIAKDPVTDSGKRSLEGVLTTVRSKMTGELMTARVDQSPISDEFEDVMHLVYHTGKLYNETTLDEIRQRLK